MMINKCINRPIKKWINILILITKFSLKGLPGYLKVSNGMKSFGNSLIVGCLHKLTFVSICFVLFCWLNFWSKSFLLANLTVPRRQNAPKMTSKLTVLINLLSSFFIFLITNRQGFLFKFYEFKIFLKKYKKNSYLFKMKFKNKISSKFELNYYPITPPITPFLINLDKRK